MDILRPENLLRYGYKDCVLCEVERKGEEKRCRRCSGRADQRERLLWEIQRTRIRRAAGKWSLVFPGLGHFHAGRYLTGAFWAALIPLTLGLAASVWQGPTVGHAVLLLAFGIIYYLAWADVRRGFREIEAPCQAACPSHVNIPDYLALVRVGRPLEALALVHDKLPFAAFCGRACPHPCEQKCVRIEWNAPIAIMAVKRYLSDIGYAAGISPSANTGEGIPSPRVAVIGAGPAGLCAADTLARLGGRVTVFDANSEPGGMMRYGAPEFRFPREAGLCDTRTVMARGVVFRGDTRFGRDFTLEDLEREGFQAVLFALGAGGAARLPEAGREEEGFLDGQTFLTRIRRGEMKTLEGRIAVIGGGDVAVDAARSAVRLGAKEVTIACLETREAMPALPWDLEDAVSEGVKVLPSVAVRMFRIREGRVAGFEALRVRRIAIDASGSILPETEPGSGFEVAADTIVVAIGSGPGTGALPSVFARNTVDSLHHVYRLIFGKKETRIPAYACGDVVSGPGTVVEASASGRAAALNIYEALCVEEVRKARYVDNYRRAAEGHLVDRPEWRQRRRAPRLSPEESRRTFREVEKGLTDEDAHHEAERCARCNLWL